MKKVTKWNLCDAEKFSFKGHINEFILKREQSDTSEIFTVVIPIGGETHSQVHTDMEQIFYVLQGYGELITEEDGIEKKIPMEEKNILWVPMYAPHKIINNSKNCDLKYLCINSFDILKRLENGSAEHANNVVAEHGKAEKTLNERPICIIGANGFIGRTIVTYLLRCGKYVWAFDEKKSDCSYDRVDFFQVEKNADYYTVLKDLCLKKGICPERFIYSAGNNQVHKHSLHYSSNDFAEQVQDNLIDAFNWISAYAKCCFDFSMKGTITVLSSVGAQKSHREMCGYDSAKAGLEGLCRSLALDYAVYGITINALEIGPIMESESSIMDGEGEKAKRLRSLMPNGKYPRVWEIAKYIVDFCLNTPEFLTGQVLTLAGGLTIQLRPKEIERLYEEEMYI